MTSAPSKHRSTSTASVLPPTVRCERADMGPDETLIGELPFTGQLPCRSMLCRGALSWGALHISAEASWVSPSPGLSPFDFAAAAPIIPCVGACWIQVFVFETIVSMHFCSFRNYRLWRAHRHHACTAQWKDMQSKYCVLLKHRSSCNSVMPAYSP